MKEAILVTGHPNTFEKDVLTRDFGNFISQYGMDSYLFTNYPSNKDTQIEFKEAHFINSNPENPLINNKWFVWATYPLLGLKYNQHIPNWCYSGTQLMVNGLKYLKSLGYTHVYTFIYDTKPLYPEIKEFIELSRDKFKNNKKALFFEYPLRREDDGTYKGLTNHIFSGEIEFLLEIFSLGILNYNNTNPIFQKHKHVNCESYWKYIFGPFENLIEILPTEKTIPSVFASTSFNKIEGYEFAAGRYQDTTIIAIKGLIKDIKLTNSNKNIVDFNLLKQQKILTAIEFNSTLGNSYYLNGSKILDDTEEWRTNNFFTILK